MKLTAAFVLAMTLVAPLAAAAAAWDVGPPVGEKVPAIHATDLKGAPVGLKDLSGKNGVVLIFFRSAKWCPYCQKQLMDMKDAPGPLAQRGYKLAALSYDPTDVLDGFTEKRGITYPLLSDLGSVTIDRWKLRDVRYKPDSFAWGVPYASIYVISPKGVLQAKLAEEDYKVRPELSVLLATIDGLPQKR
ncbi:peroxiredoxin family protein [Phenylobacterium sp.]|uniref:peroxiredoxin family protein n=1 Tax=Phenylobacterium sp. TaxID=1871053 RepID=UPI002B99D865|nr:peroxiredoxin family protein [Phenylobacterium sp.]HLZ73377.1 peroxiredoxin family protein [Phenylobacterium sp.]